MFETVLIIIAQRLHCIQFRLKEITGPLKWVLQIVESFLGSVLLSKNQSDHSKAWIFESSKWTASLFTQPFFAGQRYRSQSGPVSLAHSGVVVPHPVVGQNGQVMMRPFGHSGSSGDEDPYSVAGSGSSGASSGNGRPGMPGVGPNGKVNGEYYEECPGKCQLLMWIFGVLGKSRWVMDYWEVLT